MGISIASALPRPCRFSHPGQNPLKIFFASRFPNVSSKGYDSPIAGISRSGGSRAGGHAMFTLVIGSALVVMVLGPVIVATVQRSRDLDL